MTGLLALPILGGTVAMLFLLAIVAPRLPPPAVPGAMLGLCALAYAASGVFLSNPERIQLVLPFGFGLLPARLAMDPLSAFFILAVALPAGAGTLGRLDVRPALLGAVLLLFLAGDAGTLVLALAAAASLARASAWQVAGLLAVAAGLALLAGLHPDFAALRLAPPTGWRALAGAALLLAGIVPLLALAPGALGPTIACYLLLRLVLDLGGPVTPLWWGVPPLLLGAAFAIIAGLQALHAPDVDTIAAALSRQPGGWMLAALGAALVARGADLPPLAAFAASAALMLVISDLIAAELLAIAARAVSRGAGSLRLEALGGLARAMPAAAAAVLVAGLNVGLVPLTAGFAAAWMVFQSVFSGARIGGWPLQLAFAAAAVLLATAAALSAAAAIRLGAAAFLGRPRTPRAAAADDAGRGQRYAIIALAALSLLVGLLPGAVLQLTAPASVAGLLAPVATQRGIPGYGPAALACVLLALLLFALLAGRRARSPELAGPWEDGFTAPPPWLPFGDPDTQASPEVLALGIPALRWPLLPRLRLPAVRALPPAWALLALAGAALLAGLA